jgi:2-polyprenyl-3-methyl-5-hydroxy-6-metoxy-1,4-benzoquinol methylase
MSKKIKFESYKYRFLMAAQAHYFEPEEKLSPSWKQFVNNLTFDYEKASIQIKWETPESGSLIAPLRDAQFYYRGDSERSVTQQVNDSLLATEDPIKLENDTYFKKIVMRVADSSGYRKDEAQTDHDERIQNERDFHDAWADSEEVEKINVRESNEVCTAPEMRYIAKRMGDLKGKRLLDIGCGLGEASVYFAILGADVTSSDLSQGMLDATQRLAKANNVEVKQHLASAEDMQLSSGKKFDVIYAGNLLHHVNIEETLVRIKPHLNKGGVLVTWDPLAYNPAINIYRKMATDVRTPDEHPLRWSDIKLFHEHFSRVETKYFWFTTLIIFVIMSLAQRRNPNKERYWKVVVEEGNKWSWLYRPLEALDRLILKVIPPFRLLCWNVVIISEA